MSHLLSAKELCERALRLIGAFSIVDSQADAEEMAEALFWLDLIVAELSGTSRILFLVPDTMTLPLTAGKGTYVMQDDLGTGAPKNGIEFPVECWIENAGGNRFPVKMVSRREFEEMNHNDTGTPTHVYIDRLGSPTLRTYPTLGAEVADGTYIKIVAQTYAETFAKTNGVKATGLRAAWQRWCIYELASNIGAGPVRRVSAGEIRDIKAIAEEAKKRLLAYENKEHLGLPQITEFRDF